MSLFWSAIDRLPGTPLRTRGPEDAIYLSFDDGPDPEHTPRLLEVLHRHGVPATFFVIGLLAEARPGCMQDIVAGGHALGNHSMAHPVMGSMNRVDQWTEIARAETLLTAIDGHSRHAFRPPHGRVTWGAFAGCARHRVRLQLWTRDSLDYRLDGAAVTARLRARPPVARDVLLFHDDGPAAALALDALLPVWRDRGLRFAALWPDDARTRPLTDS
jgi:peptidoglycan-N-acetylglucosamine deacetylase